MSYSQTLYSTDSKGKVRQWSIEVINHTYIVTHGVKGGKMQSKYTHCKAKNIGKVNETTPEAQAIIEAQAKWTFQMDREDYHYDVSLANRQIRPMLALDFLKVPHRVDWIQAMAQPKLDGVRLTVGRRFRDEEGHEMMTRKGETYVVPHLVDPTIELLSIVNELCEGRCLALDGEAYLHGLSLQNILSRVKKYRKGLTEEIQYYLFDLIIPDMEFHERCDVLSDAFGLYQERYNDNNFVLVNTVTIPDELTMKEYHGYFTENGYEGLIIRHRNSQYGIAQRSPDLFKYKHFLDDEAQIIEVWEDKNGNAMFTCRQKNGKVCKVTPKRTHTERKQMLENKNDFIDQWITCKFQAYSDEDVMQFPVGLDLRECNEFGEPIE